MSEYFVKIINRFIGIVKILCWKILYGGRFRIGKNTFFYPGSHMMLEKNGDVQIGSNCFFNRNCSVTSLGKIKIGNDCIFGENVKIYDHNHNIKMDGELFRKQGYSIGHIEIGSNVWIGSDVIILSNVKVGNNVVIAAGSIVSKDISDNTVFIQKRGNV